MINKEKPKSKKSKEPKEHLEDKQEPSMEKELLTFDEAMDVIFARYDKAFRDLAYYDEHGELPKE